MPGVGERFRNDASGIVAVLVTGVWLALLVLGAPTGVWLAVMLFGYIALVPLAEMLFEDSDDTDSPRISGHNEAVTETGTEDALERLRRRYADGELTEEQFERKLERLLRTETLEDVEEQFSKEDSHRSEQADFESERQ